MSLQAKTKQQAPKAQPKDKYTTPLILRTGILYSVRVTLPLGVAWAMCSFLSFYWTNQLHNAAIDTWNYAFFLLIFCFIALSRMTMGVFAKILGSKEIEDDLHIVRFVKIPQDNAYKTKVEELFSDPVQYKEFIEDVKSIAFSKKERYLWIIMLITVVLFSPIYWEMYTRAGIYDAPGTTPYLPFYVFTNLFFGAFFFPAYVSLIWLVVAVIRVTYSLDGYGASLKISNLVQLLEKEDPAVDNEEKIQGYNAFYSTLKPVGSYISRATVLILLVAIISSVGSVTGSFLLEVDLGVGLNLIALGVSGTAIGLFLIAQYVLHLLLRSRKEHILGICCEERDKLSIRTLLRLKKKLPENRGRSPDELAAMQRENEDQEKETRILSVTQDLITSVDAGSTWGFSGSELVEFLVALSFEFILLFV